MFKRRILRTFLILAQLGLLALTPLAGPARPAVAGDSRIDSLISDELAARGRANLFVKLASDADLSAAAGLPDRAARPGAVYRQLTGHAARSQQGLLVFLRARGASYQSFWINNSVFVPGADAALVRALAARADVAYLRGNHQARWIEPVRRQAAPGAVNQVEWNIGKIHADDVWTTGNVGQGAVVGSMDSGVRYTHLALVRQYRGNNGDGTFSHDYNWYDPNLAHPEPVDPLGHGTHVMGIMAGDDGAGNQIGVAPGTKWITVGLGLIPVDRELIAGAQWMLCPTRVDGTAPDCSKAPDVINNSWGGPGGDDWYNSYLRAWVAAGIVPVFAIGNDGPACRTALSPGDSSLAIGVGATDAERVLADFSSKGPGAFRPIKPDLVAPGDSIRSAVSTADDAYVVMSGTSMAAPHVAGTVALMLTANPNANYVRVYNVLVGTTRKFLGDPPGPNRCAGREFNVFPNAIYGWGQVEAAVAVDTITP